MNLLKAIMISLGTVSLLLGVSGLFIPGLPTTPFLLLTAVLYVRSSDKLYQLLITNKLLGAYILHFRMNKGMTKKSKIFAICTMWLMITISSVFFLTQFHFKLLVLVIGVIGTIIMGFIVPTVYNSTNRNK